MTAIPALTIEYDNAQWVEQNAEVIYLQIEADIKSPNTIERGINTLLLIYPQLLNREDVKNWVRLADTALRRLDLNVKKDEFDPKRPEYLIGPWFTLKRMDHGLLVVPSGKRRRHRLNPRQLLETYLILTMTLYVRKSIEMDDRRIFDMLGFARIVNSSHLYHKVYQILAYVYSDRDEYAKALDFGRLAHVYFEQTEQAIEKGLCSLILGRIHYEMKDPLTALRWLEAAEATFDPAEYPAQHAYVTMLKGNTLICEQNFAEAERFLAQSLQEYEYTRTPEAMAQAQHNLAVAQIHSNHLNLAYDNVNHALTFYQRRADQHGLGQGMLTLALIESRMGQKDMARGHLAEARPLLQNITDQHHRQRSLDFAEEVEKSIEGGEVPEIPLLK